MLHLLLEALCAVFALAAAWGASVVAHARSKALIQGQADLKQFKATALALLADKSIPVGVVDFVTKLSRDAGGPRLAIWAAKQILNGQMFEPPKSPNREFRNELAKLTDEQRQLLSQCVAYCLMSSAAASWFWATAMRRVISFGLFDEQRISDTDKTRAIVVQYTARGETKRHFKLSRAA